MRKKHFFSEAPADTAREPRFIMLGGFLGAGKTTTVLQLALWLKRQGYRPGVITNDQAAGLVDTALVEQLNLPVREISGGCFCCRSETLVDALNRLEAEQQPDVFIAEPVGSCTDLVATVGLPLTQIYGKNFQMAPYTVLVDPFRAEQVMGCRWRVESEKEKVKGAESLTVVRGKRLSAKEQRELEKEAPGATAIMQEMEEVIARIGSGWRSTGNTVAPKVIQEEQSGGGFHEDVNYIYRKQLEEAEVIVINKVDLISGARLASLRAALAGAFPQAQIMETASRDGLALEPLFTHLLTQAASPARVMHVDYERYGRGEAMLGWLNATVKLKPAKPGAGKALLEPVVQELTARLRKRHIEVAHLKLILSDPAQPKQLLRLQMTRADEVPEIAGNIAKPVKQGELVINLRAAADPKTLEALVKQALAKAWPGGSHTLETLEAFKPGQPVPTHRVAMV